MNILAEVLGLKNAASKRFVEVPVEKGWTSYKDFIGYYNPFSESLEKSNPVAFDALSLLSAECEQGVADGDAVPYLFLLDEANLSSIEHYWSPFLRACDSASVVVRSSFLWAETTFLQSSELLALYRDRKLRPYNRGVVASFLGPQLGGYPRSASFRFG